MQLSEIFDVLKRNKLKYSIWLMANIGGILVSSLAASTIYLVHRSVGGLLPNKEVFLVTGTISLCVTGVSYLRTRENHRDTELTATLIILWPFIIAIVYGFLIALGSNTPKATDFTLYIIAILLFLVSMIWSSLIWAHERGIEKDYSDTKEKPNIDENLINVASNLPKIDRGSK